MHSSIMHSPPNVLTLSTITPDAIRLRLSIHHTSTRVVRHTNRIEHRTITDSLLDRQIHRREEEAERVNKQVARKRGGRELCERKRQNKGYCQNITHIPKRIRRQPPRQTVLQEHYIIGLDGVLIDSVKKVAMSAMGE